MTLLLPLMHMGELCKKKSLKTAVGLQFAASSTAGVHERDEADAQIPVMDLEQTFPLEGILTYWQPMVYNPAVTMAAIACLLQIVC